MKKLLGAMLLLCAALSWAQARIEDGGHEIQLWTGGGPSFPGGTSHTGVWNARLAFGGGLTPAPRPWFLKGKIYTAPGAVPPVSVFSAFHPALGARVQP